MSHLRTQIRAAALAAIAAEVDDTVTVLASRILPLEEGSLPAILVYANAEEARPDDFEAVDRTLSLVAEAVAQGDDLDTALDPLVVAIELALNGQTFSGLALDTMPASLETSMTAEGAAPVGRARLTFDVRYRTSLADPENPY